MKLIIAGSRHLRNPEAIEYAVRSMGIRPWDIEEIVSGHCWGTDLLGELWARKRGIPIKVFPADWLTHGRKAGPLRNEKMARYANALLAIKIVGVESRGTDDMIRRAEKHKLHVHIFDVPKTEALSKQ